MTKNNIKIKRDDFIKESLKCIGIKYKIQGRNEHGLDCLGLPIFVLKKFGVDTDEYDEKGYTNIPDGVKLVKKLHEYTEYKKDKNFENGDLLLMNFLKNPQHLGIYYNYNGMDYMIHAYDTDLGVVMHRIDKKWNKRIVAVFKIKELY